MLAQDAASLLAALPEPALVVGRGGDLLHHNRPAERVFGARRHGAVASHWAADAAPDVEAYLTRCIGSASPLVGALTVRAAEGPQRFQTSGARVDLASGPAVLLRLTRSSEERFQALTRKVDELHAEVAQRKRTEAILQETVRDRDVLMRELQHRVKNNMQMLAGMLSGAAREAATPEARAALTAVSGRFAAVSAVQQLLYSDEAGVAVGSDDLVATLIKAVRAIDRSVEIDVRVDPVELPTEKAVLVALILNELLTNALKYGRPAAGAQRIGIELSIHGEQMQLTVRDSGPGFVMPASGRRASGLGLVKALLRQLGGRLDIVGRDGGGCAVMCSFGTPRLQQEAA